MCYSTVIDRYIGRKASDVDKRLLQINLPGTVSRAPRSITQRKYWKGDNTYIIKNFIKLCTQLVNGNHSCFTSYQQH